MSLPTSVTSQGLKRALRKEIRTALSKIPRDLIQNESTKVTQHLLALPQYKQCQRLSVYLSMDKEVDTTAILQHAFDSGEWLGGAEFPLLKTVERLSFQNLLLIISFTTLSSLGKACYIPRWTATDMSMVRLSSFADYQQLPVNRWGIPEPQMDEPREDGKHEIVWRWGRRGGGILILPPHPFLRILNPYPHLPSLSPRFSDAGGRPRSHPYAMSSL